MSDIAEVLHRNGLPKDECERKAARLGVGPATRRSLETVARLLEHETDDLMHWLEALQDAKAILAEVLR